MRRGALLPLSNLVAGRHLARTQRRQGEALCLIDGNLVANGDLAETSWGHFLAGTRGWVARGTRNTGSTLSASPLVLYPLRVDTNLGFVPSQMGHFPSPPKLGQS